MWAVYIILFLLLLLLLWVLAVRGKKSPFGFYGLYRYRYAHRGLYNAASGVPENSLTAFRLAVEHGCGAELDVHLSKDGRLVVMHDGKLLRMTGVDRRIVDCTADELDALRLDGTEEKIPYLEEVLPIFAGRTPLIIELKPDDGNAAALARKTVVLLKKFPKLRFCVESFDPRVLIWLRRNCPEIVRGQLAENYLTARQGFKAPAAFALTNLLANFLTVPNFVAYRYADRAQLSLRLCRRLWGVQEVAWTLQTPQEILDAEHDGCIVIFEHCIPPEKRK